MRTLTNTVFDQRGFPVAGAQVSIRDNANALVDLNGGNPVITNSWGAWSAQLEAGEYTIEIRKGSALLTRPVTVCPDA